MTDTAQKVHGRFTVYRSSGNQCQVHLKIIPIMQEPLASANHAIIKEASLFIF